MDNLNFDDLVSKTGNYDNIFVFGFSEFGKLLYDTLSSQAGTNKTLHFCDSNAESKSHPVAKVFTPGDAVSSFPDALFIIGSLVYTEEMHSQLIGLGVAPDNIMQPPLVIIKRLKFRPRTSLGNIEYHLTEHCNLNCAGCLHFSCIADEEYADFEVFKSDMSRLSDILGGEVASVHLLGGEPLLHPRVEEFISFTRTLLPQARVHLDTNGILLLKMPMSFWNCLKQNQIIIKLTKYPINIDMGAIRERAAEYGVTIYTDEFPGNNWDKYIFDLNGALDPKDNFLRCPRSNAGCVRLYKGRLYPCTAVGNAEHFNRRFGKNLEHTEKDSIDIYSDVTARDIFDFLANPVPFCRYCDMKKRKIRQQWRPSKQEISEFLE